MDGWRTKKIPNFEDNQAIAVAAWLNHEIRARFQVSLTSSSKYGSSLFIQKKLRS
jgi:hypothetical protein